MKRQTTKVWSWLCMISLVIGSMVPILMSTPSYAADSGKATILGYVTYNSTGDPDDVSYPLGQTVTVKLVNGGTVVASTKTYENGRYFFHNVADGNYTVEFSAMIGFNITTPATSEESITIDSSANRYFVDALYSQIPNIDIVQSGDSFQGYIFVPYPEHGGISYNLETPPAHGEIIDVGYVYPIFVYEADSDYTGPDSFTIIATTNEDEYIIKRDIIIIEPFEYPVNEPPTIFNEHKETMINTAVSGGPVAIDLEMDWFMLEVESGPSHGVVEWDEDEYGIWTYTPNENYVGTDTFTVKVLTGEGGKEYVSTNTIVVKPTPISTPSPTPTSTPTSTPTPISTPSSTPDPTPTPSPPVIEPPKLEYVRHFDYIFGYPDGTVRPENNISREEVATIFYRLMEDNSRKDYISNTHSFEDVMSDRWSNKIIATMNKANVINGYLDGTFGPGRPITRAEFATIASRFDKLDERTNDFLTDISGHWAEKYITSAANKGWIKGYTDNTFKPDQYITRAEAMTLINSVLDRHVQEKDIHKDARQWPDNKPEHWYYRDVLEATNYHEYSKEEDEETEIWLKILPHRIFP